MSDPTQRISNLALSFSGVLVDDWDELSAEQRNNYRILAYNVYISTMTVRHNTFVDAAAIVEDLLGDPKTPQRWMPGIKEALNAIRVYAIQEEEAVEVAVRVPETLPDDFMSDDPYSDIRAGQPDPYTTLVDVENQCGEVHASGFTCTRPDHPPHWKHWDGDRVVQPPFTIGNVHVTWVNDDDFETVDPEIVDDDSSI